MDDREARRYALNLLKKKLKTSNRQRQCGTLAGVDSSSDAVGPQEKPSGVVRTKTPEAVDLDTSLPTNQDADHCKDPNAVFTSCSNLEAALPPTQELAEIPEYTQSLKMLKKLVVKWSCTRCKRECIPVREESRCLCGHRYKEHPSRKDDPRVVKNKALASAFSPFQCTAAKCACKAFFYVVAEGAWILRCRCKHKHTDHDPGAKPFKCQKAKCVCDGFDSPWVCNCDHPWNDHVQETIEKQFKPLDLFQEQFQVEELNCVKRTHFVADPMRL